MTYLRDGAAIVAMRPGKARRALKRFWCGLGGHNLAVEDIVSEGDASVVCMRCSHCGKGIARNT